MEKRGRGRPPKPPDERMVERVEVRADQGEKQRLELAAERAGMKLSDWIRDRLKTAADAELGKQKRR
jgi:predicted HicB family RNase H-like nuclease